jgi:hypothetical protein
MTARQPRRKAPRSYQKHGLGVLKRAVRILGNRGLLDGRTKIGRALGQWRSELVADLGGQDAISTWCRSITTPGGTMPRSKRRSASPLRIWVLSLR